MHRAVLKSALMLALLACGQPVGAQETRAPAVSFNTLSAQAEEARAANRLNEAIALYRKALSVRPSWAEGWWYLGTLLYDQDQYGEAATAFRKAATLNPKIGTSWVMLGLCEYKLDQNDAALRHIQRGRQLGTSKDPQFFQVMLYHEGLLLLAKAQFEKAQETLASLVRAGVETEDVRVALGLSVLRLAPSELPAGDSALRQVVLRAGWSEVLAVQKQFDRALQEYERLSADFSKKLNIHYAFGRFLLTRQDPEKAVAAFQREIENHPEHVLARLAIASVKASTDPGGGLAYAEEAVKLNPHIPLGRYLLGSLLLHTDQTARAIQELETARRDMPNDSRVYYALGRAYARANRKQDAERARAAFKRLTKESQEGGKTGVGESLGQQAQNPR
ncbi:MAG: tetratricopeptide repeat protein [Acidobacteriota bacterium]